MDADCLGDFEELDEPLVLPEFEIDSPFEKDSVFDVRTERVRAAVIVPPFEDEVVALRNDEADLVNVPVTDAVEQCDGRGDKELVRDPLDVNESFAEDEEEIETDAVKVDALDDEALAEAVIEAVSVLTLEIVMIGDIVVSIVFDFVPTANDLVKVGGKDCVAVVQRVVRDVAVTVCPEAEPDLLAIFVTDAELVDESEFSALGDELGEFNAEFEPDATGDTDTDAVTERDAHDEDDELGLIVFVDVLESDDEVKADFVRVFVAIVDRVMTTVDECVADKRAVTVTLDVPD